MTRKEISQEASRLKFTLLQRGINEDWINSFLTYLMTNFSEPINNNKLDDLAHAYSDKDLDEFREDSFWSCYADDIVCDAREEGTWKAYMAGYRDGEKL